MSIALTVAPQINTVLGGNTQVSYDTVVLSPVTFDQYQNRVSAKVRLTASGEPDMDIIQGSLEIFVGQGKLVFTVPQLDIVRKMTLSGAQITAVSGIMSDAADALESGIISVGVVDGTQSTGA